MSKYLFIRVERVKSDLKFRLLPDQTYHDGTVLNPKKDIRIQNGKSLKDFEAGTVYAVENSAFGLKIMNSDSGTVRYSSKYWRCTSIEKARGEISKFSSYKTMIEEYDAYISKHISLEAEKIEKEKEERATTESTYFSKLRTDFLRSKPTVSSDGFYMSDSDWMILIRNIKRNINTLITGPTGSGKTTAIKLACEKLGIPCSVYDMGSMFDPISSLLGVHRLEDGSSKFDYAKFAQDIQKPGVILLDELSRAPIQSNNILFPCLDDRRTLPVEIAGCKDTRTITVHPEVCFIATANIGAEYTGTNIMDRALQNRFFPIELNYLDSKQESKVLQQRCGISEADANLIVRVATEIRNIYKKQELSIFLLCQLILLL